MRHLFHTTLAAGICAMLAGFATVSGATTIVDTGSSGNGTNYGFYSSSWLAGEFTVGSATQINSVEGIVANQAATAMNFQIAIYSDSPGLPGSALYTTGDIALARGTAFDWYGSSGLSWDIASGTYWIVFTTSDSLQMLGSALTPMDAYAYSDNADTDWHPYALKLAVRIDGTVSPVPLPATGLLLVAAIAGLGAAKRRRKA